MSYEQICNVTGRIFIISDAEIALRESFGVPLPTVHPTERMRELMTWRPQHVLYPYTCGRCGKEGLRGYPPTTRFPKYCKVCYYADGRESPRQDVDLDRPFFVQFEELVNKTPRLALSVTEPVENSDYCNAVTSVKNCYMCFNLGLSEHCMYVQGGMYDKECVDTFAIGNSEIAYECMNGGFLYKTYWSQYVIKCVESYFLYDCEDCMNCFMSSGLRHKQYVFRNEQLAKEEYEQRMRVIDFGSFQTICDLSEEYKAIVKSYSKRGLVGIRNENVSGNYLYYCKDTHESYMMEQAERCVNCYNLVNRVEDCLDVCAFGYGLEKIYFCCVIGGGSYNIRYSTIIPDRSKDIEYCIEMRSCSDCFGSVGLRKKQYCILNTQYSQEEYKALKQRIIEHMKETSEYGKFFPKSMSPWGYNETVAQLVMPLTQEEAKSKGFKWFEKPIPQYTTDQVYAPPDNIRDIEWNDLAGKVIVCEESGRPFKIVKQEFDFYKTYSVPIPRLHPDVRLKHRFPTGELYNIHDAQCASCKITIQTSMRDGDSVLCESCYQKAVY